MKNKDVFDLVLKHVMTVPDEEFASLSETMLSQTFKIDRTKLSRQFKRQTGMTLEDFLFKEKMTRAASLLKDQKDIKVKEVSKKIGFCTSDYFIRRFREYNGIVPGRYKELKTSCIVNVDIGSGTKDRSQEFEFSPEDDKNKCVSDSSITARDTKTTPETPDYTSSWKTNVMKPTDSRNTELTAKSREQTEDYPQKVLIKSGKKSEEKKEEIWENSTHMYSQIVDIDEENELVHLNCKYDRNSNETFERVFPLKHFKNKDKLIVDQSILIIILEKPGEVRFLFDEEVDEDYFNEDLNNISINDLKDSPIFNPL
ncbi:MAG: helix-turn-helix domain-containing protein [Candidatus Aminicenantes bacterium]|nr:helix-turn-helix domain-containing protein [Candidatus Aminicenantes bacterium]NIM77469.1 helix-turn-helix domain-containing protein [Candidatus Aminicenantes bacterium]NIN16774.1 helix-turn-helix domain-containing protein [Candidatus Aminicenantes bacterium]NIN40630.1 helix-turn-helix domain-containing protein [Candidatus Aminicenantes bacterium]NIN83451.1 helix-turn-helix domain-containing protein [Candidatus Aminicenantes bacterium]